MDLAEIIRDAIASNSALINATGARWSDRPIQIEVTWMPAMQKLDMTIRTVDHLPVFRPERHAVAGSSDE